MTPASVAVDTLLQLPLGSAGLVAPFKGHCLWHLDPKAFAANEKIHLRLGDLWFVPDSLKCLVLSFANSHGDMQWVVLSELSQPFTKISLRWFTRSKDSGNETLRELWQKEKWMGRKWKGFLPCSGSRCTDSGGASWEGTQIVLTSPLAGRGTNSPRQRLTQEIWPEPAGSGGQREQSTSDCHGQRVPAAPPHCPGNLFLLSSSAGAVTRKYYVLHVLSIWWSICKLYHSCMYFTVNINDAQLSCVHLKDI